MNPKSDRNHPESGSPWLGEIPSHWTVMPIKAIAEVRTSNVDKKSYDGEASVRLCNYTDVYYNDVIEPGMEFMEATASAAQLSNFQLRAGDVLVTKDSETADDIGLSAFVPTSLDRVVCGYHLALYRPRDLRYGSYLKRLFDSAYLKARLHVAAQGVTRVGLSHSALKGLPIPVPPPDEAKRIADFLDGETAEIDAFIADQGELVEVLQERRGAVVARAVTKGLDRTTASRDSGVDWLGPIPAHWSRERLSRLGVDQESGTSVNGYGEPAAADEIGVLKTGSASKGYFDPTENKRVTEEDLGRVSCPVRMGSLLVNRANTPDLVGSAAYIDSHHPNLYLSDKLWQINFENADNRFMYWWTKGPVYRSQLHFYRVGASASMQNLSFADFRGLDIALPPLDEQRAIAAYLDAATAEIDAAIADAKEAIELSRERRAALISAAVTGRIDVRNHVAALGV